MARSFPTFQHPSLGVPVRLTKAVVVELAHQARRHGHLRRGYDAMAGAEAVEVNCPLCRSYVRGWYGPYAELTTATQALDFAMVSHLANDCRSVTRPD